MKFTNKHNLPEAIVNAVKNDLYEKGDAKYSATELLSPPQLNRLRKLHWHELEVDVSEEIWKIFGSAVHHILEQGSQVKVTIDEESEKRNINPFVETEKRLYSTMGGIKISGKPDWYNSLEGIVQDYKVTQVYKVTKGDIMDWEAQGNIYAWLFQDNNKEVKTFQIVALLKDWKPSEKARAKEEDNYPETQVQVVDIPLMSPLSRARLVLERVEMHEAVASLTDPALIYKASPCSPEDRWHQEDSFAVMKKGGKRATPGGIFDNLEDAQAFLEEKGDEYEIEERIGADIRCENKQYCPVSKFCAQFKDIQLNKRKGTVELPNVELPEKEEPLLHEELESIKEKELSTAEKILARMKAKRELEARQEKPKEGSVKDIMERLDKQADEAKAKVTEENSLGTLLSDIDDILEGL